MNSTNFYSNFTFQRFSFGKYRFTDHFSYPGSPSHFIGKIINGSATLNTHNNRIDVKEGDVFYIPKNVMYQSRWYGDSDEKIEFLSLGFKVFPKEENTAYALQVLKLNEKAEELLLLLENSLIVDCKNIGLLYTLLGELMPLMTLLSPEKTDKSLKSAIDYMNNNISATVSDVAKHCTMSESGIYSLFKRTLNKTPNQIRLSIVMGKAQELLETTDKPIEEISDMLNFSSSSYFRKVIKEQTGKTPTEIRKQAQF